MLESIKEPDQINKGIICPQCPNESKFIIFLPSLVDELSLKKTKQQCIERKSNSIPIHLNLNHRRITCMVIRFHMNFVSNPRSSN